MIEVLNLNYRELTVERSTLIEYLDGKLNEGECLCGLIKSYEEVSSSGARVSFANVAIQYLRNQGSCPKPA